VFLESKKGRPVSWPADPASISKVSHNRTNCAIGRAFETYSDGAYSRIFLQHSQVRALNGSAHGVRQHPLQHYYGHSCPMQRLAQERNSSFAARPRAI
jgi:hypothetical protein